jgi:hypothetical protein
VQLDQAKLIDTSVTDEHVQQAEREAEEAAELLSELERRAAEDPEPPTPVAVVEARELGRFARLRAAHTRKRADQAKAAARLLALHEVGQDVTALAAEAGKPNAAIEQAARKLALAATTLTELCRIHDEQVTALVDRAKALDVEEPAPVGPRATSAFVSLVKGAHGRPDGIQAGRTRVLLIGSRARDAALIAAEGNADGAAALIASVNEQAPMKRAARYYRAAAGIVSEDSPQESPVFAQQVRDGELVPLTKAEIDAYVNGVLDGAND